MKKLIKENKQEIISVTIFFAIIFLVSIGGILLIENGKETVVLLILMSLIFGVIGLNIRKRENEKKYKQLLRFAHKFYEKERKMNAGEDDFEDYTLGEFEEEFEDWVREERLEEIFKK